MNQKLKHSENKQEARLQFISENSLFMSQEEMAKDLKVSRSTIQRDLEAWYDTGRFKQLIVGKFLHHLGKAEREEKSIKILDRIIIMFKYLPAHTSSDLVKDILVSFNLDNKYSLDDSVLRLKPVTVGVSDGVESTE